MRKHIVVVLAVAVLNLPALAARAEPPATQAQTRPTPETAQTPPTLETLSGVWNAEPLKVRLNSAFDVSVWGPDASSLRRVELTIRPSGEGTIKVTRSVVDGRGKPKPATVSVEEAQLHLKMPAAVDPKRFEPIVDVLKPQRRYLDDAASLWPLDGLVVKLVATDLDHDRLNLQFDLPDGRGSFGETLVRQHPGRH